MYEYSCLVQVVKLLICHNTAQSYLALRRIFSSISCSFCLFFSSISASFLAFSSYSATSRSRFSRAILSSSSRSVVTRHQLSDYQQVSKVYINISRHHMTTYNVLNCASNENKVVIQRWLSESNRLFHAAAAVQMNECLPYVVSRNPRHI